MSQQPVSVSKNRERARRYAPMLAILSSLAIAIFALPSVLNLPQANPAQVAEYAPVPPESDEQAPPGGNFAGLGLGDSSTIGEEEIAPPVDVPPIKGAARSVFRCVIVNGVPRQTEDPLSPPCVSAYEGDNGGKTYKGVDAKEINVVYYIACSQTNNTFSPTSKGQEGAQCGQMVDLDDPPQDSDFLYTRALKRYSVYFNARYQTYKRHVHMYAYYGNHTVAVVGSGGCQEDCRRQDAATTIEEFDPFAVIINGGINDYMDAYTSAMAQKKVLNFGGSGSRRTSFYRQHKGLVWNYNPSLDEQATLYSNYICRSAVNEPVSFTGNPDDMGKKRKFGILFGAREGDSYSLLKDLIVERLRACGAGTMPQFGYTDQGSLDGDPATAPTKSTQLTQLRNQGVTSVLWIGPPNGRWGMEANRIGYRPEWIVFGDGGMEDFVNARYINDSVWRHAWVVSNVTKIGRQDDQLCALAIREVDPGYPAVDIPWTCGFYDNLRQLFTGIQVAGPRLAPDTVDSGFHAIPAVASTDPQVPACFYRPGDYTCVKDAVAMWWDPQGVIPSWTGEGCYRMVERGKRYLASAWPRRNVTAPKSSKDACNGYTSNGSLNPYQQTS